MRPEFLKMNFPAGMTFLALPLLLTGCNPGTGGSNALRPQTAMETIQGEEPAAMASVPNVPPPIRRNHATRVKLHVEVKEHVMTLADGVTYTYWSFGDESPGKFIRVREGDMVEVHLSNHPDNSLAHNIDFHAATGPGGGGEASFIAPGHTAIFAWRAMRPGLYLYHCVAAPAGLHISSGMYGLILVEPKGGLPRVDKEFCIVQGEFYTKGAYGEAGHQEFSLEKAVKEQPEYVVFNGKVGALMGANALKAKAGETVRLYLGNAGPSLVSSFHIVGEIFDRVYGEGGVVANQNNVQTTMVPVGGSAMVEFAAEVPGEYTLVDHSMFRAFNKGTMGQMRVEGAENEEIFSGRMFIKTFAPGTTLDRFAKAEAAPATPVTQEQLMAHGSRIYASTCIACHQADGQGMPGVFPPLAKSDFLMADKARAIQTLLHGRKGEITVNGKVFNGEMPKLPLSDADIAGALTYVRNSFGNRGSAVSVEEVGVVRQLAGDATPAVKTAFREPTPEKSARLRRAKVSRSPRSPKTAKPEALSRGPEAD